ncbi:copper amine oxidase family protein [Schinkia azotoformans MEV2011]|uniref:Copper amine oxidase family protein n=1 Tax=Schinkia azotoformans MEV2011 TaxID=1348973 RepID=A0A072NP48_SCHAZ|nr:copper amine oxidase N-terminal domain-containing protein [Schinkia azotoformans]KEF39027.1 copper amine oxidase family protein [Schinkia azotoformans MEV2011]MEC1697349.1 copper amine oxidase N-terminal domain-containing protein [Schinkia azotoformans]MEC1718506.1 copper amine oxidase N-terminal domain-containing protein [Schinkia azotoformans]MEC1724377.1 copper amine oxidase N-terminal domain-containing protein [Schinkia azotoformans]MEC1742131.1 copper amine oxidase N-terminal domain-co
MKFKTIISLIAMFLCNTFFASSAIVSEGSFQDGSNKALKEFEYRQTVEFTKNMNTKEKLGINTSSNETPGNTISISSDVINQTTEDTIIITTDKEDYYLIEDPLRTVYVNNDKVTFSRNPVIAKDYTFVPYKLTFLIFGLNAEWDKENNKIIAIKDEQRLEIEIGSNIAYYNNKEIEMEVPAQVMDSEVIVPIEWISKLFNKTVDKEIGTNSVYITL